MIYGPRELDKLVQDLQEDKKNLLNTDQDTYENVIACYSSAIGYLERLRDRLDESQLDKRIIG